VCIKGDIPKKYSLSVKLVITRNFYIQTFSVLVVFILVFLKYLLIDKLKIYLNKKFELFPFYT